MNKIMATIVAALTVISFAAIVSAADITTTEHGGAAPSAQMHKKHHKHRKHHKHHASAKKVAPTALAAAPAQSVPAPPAVQ